MRVLSISIKNLNSLRGPVTIRLDSGPLAEAGLFAITGPTGSGKSTILDAITLALYARAARYGTGKADEMMSRGTAESFAVVEFECSSGVYESRWMIKRSRGKSSGALKAARRELSREGEILATQGQVSTVIEDLTGLDYDRFLRSVLLAQGDFSAFLHSECDRRGAVLERITGTQLYSELGSKAHEIHIRQQEKVRAIEARLQGIALPSAEEIQAMEAAQDSLTAAMPGVEQARQSAHNILHDVRRAELLSSRRESYKLEYASHQNSLLEFAADAARLKLHREASAFAPELVKLEEHIKAMEQLGRDELAQTEAIGIFMMDAAAAGSAAVQSASNAMAAAGRRSAAAALEVKAGEARLEKLVEWQTQHKPDAGLTKSMPTLNAGWSGWKTAGQQEADAIYAAGQAAAQLEAKKQAAELAGKNAGLAAARAGEARREASIAAEQAAALLPKGCHDFAALEESRRAAMARLQSWESGLRAHHEAAAIAAGYSKMEEVLQAECSRITNLEKAVGECRERAAAARRELDLLKELAAAEQLTLSLVEHRHSLKDGAPCPLCGALEHPYASPAALPQGAAARVVAQEAKEVAAREALHAAEAGHGDALRSIASQQRDQATLRERLAQTKARHTAAWRDGGIDCPFLSAEAGSAGPIPVDWLELQSAQLASEVDALTNLTRSAAAAQKLSIEKEELARKVAHASELASQAAKAAAGSAERAAQLAKDAATALASMRQRLATALAAWQEVAAAPGTDPDHWMPALIQREQLWRETETGRLILVQEIASQREMLGTAEADIFTWTARRQKLLAEAARHQLELTGCEVPASWDEAEPEFFRLLQRLTAAQYLKADVAGRHAAGLNQRAGMEAALRARLGGTCFTGITELRSALLQLGIQTQLETTDSKLHLISATLRETDRQLSEELELLHRSHPQGLPCKEVAVEALDAQEVRWRELQQQSGALQEKLKAAAGATAQAGGLTDELEVQKAEAAPWARLADLIGSANGQKFSRMAQAVTLHQLVNLANDRMGTFSDRYEVRRTGDPADLELQILDRWQAHTVRPMKSLSGGETFLVSLALALGLSELAGRRARIGSLFIDEGFGTLDSEALDTALNALESLRHGHSTIGIISHVDSLKARLTTRIEVLRDGGGWSRIVLPKALPD